MPGGHVFHFNIILIFGTILIVGYLAGKTANMLHLPKVTGYIVAGIFLEPSFLGVLPQNFIDNSTVISNFALCVITYAIGGSLSFERIKKLGNTIWIMTLFESLLTFFCIAAGMYFALPLIAGLTGMNLAAEFYLPLAILAGALGAPTDPTPTLAVKDEYKADGPVTTTILGIGAFDDAMGIMIFSIAFSVCAGFLGGPSGGMNAMLLQPLGEIVMSIGLGLICAIVLMLAGKGKMTQGFRAVIILGVLFACFGVAQALGIDELLATMTLGCCVVNFAKHSEEFFSVIDDYFEEMVFVIFFVIAGAHLQLGVLKHCFWLVLVFVVLRILGKMTGAGIGALVSGAQAHVRKYTAFGLIPQGGIVVGLALLVKQEQCFSHIAIILLNIILGTTVLFEFIGPLFTEIALKRSGETGRK